jgi:hypothetical protein
LCLCLGAYRARCNRRRRPRETLAARCEPEEPAVKSARSAAVSKNFNDACPGTAAPRS